MKLSFCWLANTGVSMCSSPCLLPLQCPECLARVACTICEKGGTWLYNCYFFLECCYLDLSETGRNILVLFSCYFLSPGVSLESKWCTHIVVLTRLQLDRIPVLFETEIRFTHGLFYMYFDIFFSRWDISADVYELAYQFQRIAI